MEVPSSPLKVHSTSCNLEEMIMDMVRISTPINILRIVEWLDENKGNEIKAKKKNSRDPSPMPLVTTKSYIKVDVGVKPKSEGKKNSSQVI